MRLSPFVRPFKLVPNLSLFWAIDNGGCYIFQLLDHRANVSRIIFDIAAVCTFTILIFNFANSHSRDSFSWEKPHVELANPEKKLHSQTNICGLTRLFCICKSDRPFAPKRQPAKATSVGRFRYFFTFFIFSFSGRCFFQDIFAHCSKGLSVAAGGRLSKTF